MSAKVQGFRMIRRRVAGQMLIDEGGAQDRRLDVLGPYPETGEDAHEPDSEGGYTLFWAFAGVKYWTAATNGPREPGKRPQELPALARRMIELLESTWRAGLKSEDLLRATRDEMKRRHK